MDNMDNSSEAFVDISMEAIVQLAGGSEKACLINGRNVYLSGFVNDVTIEQIIGNEIQLSGSVTQFSYPKNNPHEVKISINNGDNIQKFQCKCSCVAGLSEKCKHVFAILLKIQKEGKVRIGTCTEIPQKWKKVAQINLDPKPLIDFCVLQKDQKVLKEINLPSEEKESTLNHLLRAFPNSAVAKHRNTRNTGFENSYVSDLNFTDEDYPEFFVDVPTTMLQSTDEIQQQFLDKFVNLTTETAKSIFLCKRSTKSKNAYRISSFQCANILYFSKFKRTNWAKKCDLIFGKDKYRNDSTYDKALTERILNRINDKKHLKIGGTLVNPEIPFISCVIDGWNPSEKRIIKLIAPKIGDTELTIHMIGILSSPADDKESKKNCFLEEENGFVTLKKDSGLYLEIQIELRATNSSFCDLLIHSKLEDDFWRLEIAHDPEFSSRQVEKLHSIFLSKIIPVLSNTNHTLSTDTQTFSIAEIVDIEAVKMTENDKSTMLQNDDEEIIQYNPTMSTSEYECYLKIREAKQRDYERNQYLKTLKVIKLEMLPREYIKREAHEFLDSTLFSDLLSKSVELPYSSVDITTTGILNESQIFEALEVLDNVSDDYTFVSDVLLPEFLIFLFGKHMKLNRVAAIQRLKDQSEKSFVMKVMSN
jgi:hypothetical protein